MEIPLGPAKIGNMQDPYRLMENRSSIRRARSRIHAPASLVGKDENGRPVERTERGELRLEINLIIQSTSNAFSNAGLHGALRDTSSVRHGTSKPCYCDMRAA